MRRLLLLAVAVIAASCGGAATDLQTPALPDWVERVYPAPGASATGARQVEVDYRRPDAPDEHVRLLIDGVDVTTYAEFQGNTLVYDPSTGPIPLESERHTATLRWVRLPAPGSDELVILDEFTWTFSMN